MKKIFTTIVLFFTGFALLFPVVTHILVPKDNSADAGIHDYWAKGFLAEPENTIDVLFLGDSELYCCVIPLIIWEEQGITSYTCGTSDQKPYQTESFLYRAFESQSPEIVLLETNVLYRDYSTTDSIPHFFEEIFPLLRYHDRWKNLTLEDFTSSVSFTYIERDKGYIYSDKVIPADNTATYMLPSQDVAAMPSKSVRHLERMAAFCREQGAQLILFSSPSTQNWDSMRHNGTARVAERLGLTYIDMNLLPQEVPIDWQLDTQDTGDHMNYDGAEKVTKYLSAYLGNLGIFRDKRTDPAFEAWNRDLADFRNTNP